MLDLLRAMDLVIVPMALDELGVRPGALGDALGRGCQAVLLTPRAQSPTGAAWDSARASVLGDLVAAHPGTLVIEDDHAGPVSGAGVYSLAGRAGPRSVPWPSRWARICGWPCWLETP